MSKAKQATSPNRADVNRQAAELFEIVGKYVKRRVRDPHAADDIVQETVISAHRHRHALQDERKLVPWVKRIALNQIRLHARRGRRSRFVELLDESAAVRDDSMPDGGFDMERFLSFLVEYETNPEFLMALTLHYGLGWTAREIASVSSIKVNTIQQRLVASRRRFEGARVAVDRATVCAALQQVMQVLSKAASAPVRGREYVHVELFAEVAALARRIAREYPEQWQACMHAAFSLFHVARVSDIRNETRGAMPWEWRRELWDWAMIQEGAAICRRLLKGGCPEPFPAVIECYLEMYAKPDAAAVDWRRCLELSRAFVRRIPSTNLHCLVSVFVCHEEGPLAAAKYLQAWLGNRALRENRRAYNSLAYYYFQAGRWREALRYDAKFLRHPVSDEIRKHVESRMRMCREKIKATAKST